MQQVTITLMNLNFHTNSEPLRLPREFCYRKPSTFRNLVKIFDQVVKKSEKALLRQDSGRADLILQGPNLTWKMSKKSQMAKLKFWGQRVLFGTKIFEIWPQKGQLGNHDADSGQPWSGRSATNPSVKNKLANES